MHNPPMISTIIAISLIPVAFLYIHAFISGMKKLKFHNISGLLAIVGDLSISIGYMIFRTFGGKVENSSINFTKEILAYFIFHGVVSLLVIILEITILTLGIIKYFSKSKNRLHGILAKILFVVWWLAFLSGELFYIVYYLL